MEHDKLKQFNTDACEWYIQFDICYSILKTKTSTVLVIS